MRDNIKQRLLSAMNTRNSKRAVSALLASRTRIGYSKEDGLGCRKEKENLVDREVERWRGEGFDLKLSTSVVTTGVTTSGTVGVTCYPRYGVGVVGKRLNNSSEHSLHGICDEACEKMPHLIPKSMGRVGRMLQGCRWFEMLDVGCGL
ncbi:hypothetical protein EVAR_34552_1 [Eumeta japonica]|uniref:Uncharacterized protein n=1 Tax=Eumeta variegata TaxID=151549 RepID=A0A4C1X5W1_EUMVA|nr:hypothetical protein EVAR_34552_1 [Eumeta japonica]